MLFILQIGLAATFILVASIAIYLLIIFRLSEVKEQALIQLFNEDSKTNREAQNTALVSHAISISKLHDLNLLSGKNFTFTKFDDLGLSEADFSNSSFSKTNFRFSSLSSAMFINADLNDVNLANTNLEYADFSGATLNNVDMSYSELDNTNFTDATLNNVIFWGDRFDSMEGDEYPPSYCVKPAYLSVVNFSNAKLNSIDFDRTIFSVGCKFVGAQLEDVNFLQASIPNIDFSGTTLKKVRFSRCDLRDTNFYNAELADVNFEDSNLEGATMPDGKRLYTEGLKSSVEGQWAIEPNLEGMTYEAWLKQRDNH